MVDTAFFTPEQKLARRADPFSFDFMVAAGVDSGNATAPPKFESGGGGLMSTLADYTRFVAMLSGGGALDGVRILGAANARLHDERSSRRQGRQKPLSALARPRLRPRLRGAHRPGKAPTAGSVGEFFWGGMMGTAFWVSPRDSLFAILMVQTPEYREYFRVLFRNLVNAAIA